MCAPHKQTQIQSVVSAPKKYMVFCGHVVHYGLYIPHLSNKYLLRIYDMPVSGLDQSSYCLYPDLSFRLHISSQPPFWYPLPLALYSSKLPVLGNYYIYNYIIIAKYYIYNCTVIAKLLTSCFMLLYVFLIFHSIPEPSPSTWCIRHLVNTK